MINAVAILKKLMALYIADKDIISGSYMSISMEIFFE